MMTNLMKRNLIGTQVPKIIKPLGTQVPNEPVTETQVPNKPVIGTQVPDKQLKTWMQMPKIVGRRRI